RGKKAVTRVRLVEHRGERALLELTLETGRTHQARVQLAHAGFPIAGDRLYGGPLAPRLLLDAHTLAPAHPTGHRPLRFERTVLPEFNSWLAHGDPGFSVYDDAAALGRALSRATRARYGLGHSGSTTAFRLVHEAGDGLPGLAVDVYGDHLVAQLHVSEHWTGAPRARVLDALANLGLHGIY